MLLKYHVLVGTATLILWPSLSIILMAAFLSVLISLSFLPPFKNVSTSLLKVVHHLGTVIFLSHCCIMSIQFSIWIIKLGLVSVVSYIDGILSPTYSVWFAAGQVLGIAIARVFKKSERNIAKIEFGNFHLYYWQVLTGLRRSIAFS